MDVSTFANGVEKHVFSRTHRSLGGPGVTVCLAGMQSHGFSQFAPIAHCLPGEVRAYNARGRQFRPLSVINQAVVDLRDHVGQPIRVFGTSMGGVMTPFLMRELRKEHDPALLEAIIVDAPSGLQSLVDYRAFLLGNRRVVGALSALPSWITAPVFIPPRSHVSIPPDMPTSRDNYLWQFERSTVQRLSGFPISLWAQEIYWMIHVARNGTLARACESHEDIWTTYIRCLLHNRAVRSCAAKDWQGWINLTLLDVAATHSGFHQNSWEFIQLLQGEHFNSWCS